MGANDPEKRLPPPETKALTVKYVGGDPCLDLVNTVDWTPRGLENERLTDYARLTRWAEGAGILPAAAAERLRRRARARSRESEAALRRAHRTRAVLRRLVDAIVAGKAAPAVWSEFNEELAVALGRLRLAPVGGRTAAPTAAWAWPGLGERLESPLWPVVWSAAKLLTSNESERLRVCPGPDCGWVYVDRSRNGLRRWCEMETCGTAEKSRRRRQIAPTPAQGAHRLQRSTSS